MNASSNTESRIIEFLSDPDYRPIERGALAKQLRVTKRNLPAFRQAVDALIESGKIREGKKGRLRLKAAAGFAAGVVRKISSGAAFVIPNERTESQPGDIYISARDLRDAQTGDEVLVRLTSRRRSGGQRCGTIEKIIERASNVFVGTYLEAQGQGFVRVDGTAFQSDIHVGDPGAKGARPNDKVVIEMLRFPTAGRTGEAVLTEVLGKRGDPGVDTLTVIRSLGLPYEFPDDVLDEARYQAEIFDEEKLHDRRDLTGETIITIDPATARDFDDAISLRKDNRGHWQLGVHIADVAHFVPDGSALDREARERGTSVYLPRHVIPMLPEVLSNGLASLQEGVVRYTKSVLIEFDSHGHPQGAEVANSAIRVTRRFAYEQVMPILNAPQKHRSAVSPQVLKLLQQMHELAMLLRRRRFEGGALELNLKEVELEFDTDGHVTGAHETEHDESHQIIEEFMLAANIAVATELSRRKLPFLRRAHGEPNELKLKVFGQFVQSLGFEIKNVQSRRDIQRILNEAKDLPEAQAVNYALLRSMKQAEYTPFDVGHYALAEDDYCHFTSPIRRYPDLLIHRLIDGILSDRKTHQGSSEEELVRLGRHCSTTERRAERAERELTKIKLLSFLEERIGTELDAVITGVDRFGFFCRGTELPAEGLVHVSTFPQKDNFDFDRDVMTLTGRRTGQVFRLGDRVRVAVAHVDVDRRELDFQLVKQLGHAQPKPKSRRTQTEKSSKRTTGKKTVSKQSKSKGNQRSHKKSSSRKNSASRKKSNRRRSS
ncbi:MAG: ribonuclease R [Planctomycetaceae bacterium]|nr:ribonuclease R [Planctomycetaceae bacterium]